MDSIQDELWYDVEHRQSKGEATFIDQGWYQNDEDDSWKLRPVVIECKHRMKKKAHFPYTIKFRWLHIISCMKRRKLISLK